MLSLAHDLATSTQSSRLNQVNTSNSRSSNLPLQVLSLGVSIAVHGLIGLMFILVIILGLLKLSSQSPPPTEQIPEDSRITLSSTFLEKIKESAIPEPTPTRPEKQYTSAQLDQDTTPSNPDTKYFGANANRAASEGAVFKDLSAVPTQDGNAPRSETDLDVVDSRFSDGEKDLLSPASAPSAPSESSPSQEATIETAATPENNPTKTPSQEPNSEESPEETAEALAETSPPEAITTPLEETSPPETPETIHKTESEIATDTSELLSLPDSPFFPEPASLAQIEEEKKRIAEERAALEQAAREQAAIEKAALAKQAAENTPTEETTPSEAKKASEASPASDPGYARESTRTKIQGSIRRRGQSSLDVEDTPAGRYIGSVNKSIERAWQRECILRREHILPGSLSVSFTLDQEGKVTGFRFDSRVQGGAIQEGFTMLAVKNAEIPAMPAEMIETLNSEELELSLTFYF